MKVLNIKNSIWFKTFHIFFVCCWFGAVLSVILIYLFTSSNDLQTVIVNNNQLIEKIDIYIIIPSSILSYLTGLLISYKTNWGFFKFKWVTVKFVLSTALILFGIFFLGPWILKSKDLYISDIHAYSNLQHKLGVSMIIQAFVIAVTIFISATKPWGKLK